MSDLKETGGGAFPVSTIHGETQYGMELRDWFAGQVLPIAMVAMLEGRLGPHPESGGGPEGFAATAYDIAAAMLAERAK